MLAQTLVAALAFAASAVALPSPVSGDVPTPVAAAELAKKTTHYGIATIYNQFGGYGSCGNKNPDSSMIVALSNYWMKDESPAAYCGRYIQVHNSNSGKMITVKVQDTCPGCDENHLDLSEGAWNSLTNNAAWGEQDISWNFCATTGC